MNKQWFKKKIMRWELFLAAILIAEIGIFGQINPKFLVPRVLFGSINDFTSICIISLFVTFVLITGGMDIQAGSIVGLTSICIGLLWQDFGMNIWAAAGVSVLVGALCGALSGFFIAYTRVQPMVVTLGGSFLYSGFAVLLTNLSATESYKGISGFPSYFTSFTKYRFFGVIPSQMVIFAVLAIIAYILLQRSKYGRMVYLCGVNESTAEYSGIKTKLIIMSTYVLSGISASIAGIIITSYLATSKADFGAELTLPIITAVVLGGTSNLGGKGSILGTVLASLIIGILRFGLSMAGVNTQYLDIPVGVLLIIVVAFRAISSNHAIMAKLKKLLPTKKSKNLNKNI